MPFLKFNLHCVLQLNSWTTTTTTTRSTVLILLYTLTVILSQFVQSARIQTYTIFSEVDSKGDREAFTENSQDLFNVSNLVKEGRVKWKCIEKGIWLEYSGVNYNFKNRNSIQYQHILHDGKCFAPAPNRAIQSIRHVGNSDLELPGISLYRHQNFTGEELYFDGTMLQLPVSISFLSYGFTGQESWTLYSGTDFTGASNVCVQPQRIDEHVAKKDILDSQLIVHHPHTSHTLIVGSIRRGCGHHNGGSTHGHHSSSGAMHPQITNKRRQIVPTLSLFSQMTARENMMHMDGTEARLPGTGPGFVSYAITGSTNWTIFSGSEFNGISKCLVAPPENTTLPEEQHSHFHTHTHFGGPVGIPIENTTVIGEEKLFSVGSIRRGCDTDSGVMLGSLSLSCMAIISVMATIM